MKDYRTESHAVELGLLALVLAGLLAMLMLTVWFALSRLA